MESQTDTTREDLAEILYLWLANLMAGAEIEKLASDLDLDMTTPNTFHRLFSGLFDLNMFITVLGCERAFIDVDKRNQTLDIFHHMVYDRRIRQGDDDRFDEWMTLMDKKYDEYSNTLQNVHDASPLQVLSQTVTDKLFEQSGGDTKILATIGAYISYTGDALYKLISKYVIV